MRYVSSLRIGMTMKALQACWTSTGLLRGLTPAIEAPDRMAFMRLFGGLNAPVQVFVDGILPKASLLVITLVRHEDEWHVFSLGPEFPPAGRVFDDWSYRASARRDHAG